MAKNGFVGDSHEAFAPKAISCREALSWLKEMGLSRVQVETDTLLLSTAINSSLVYRSSIGVLLLDCKELLTQIPFRSIGFVRRSANLSAQGCPSDQGAWSTFPFPFLVIN